MTSWSDTVQGKSREKLVQRGGGGGERLWNNSRANKQHKLESSGEEGEVNRGDNKFLVYLWLIQIVFLRLHLIGFLIPSSHTGLNSAHNSRVLESERERKVCVEH